MMMATNLIIDCNIKGEIWQKPIDDLIDLQQFITINPAKEYFIYSPYYTARLLLCQRVIDCGCEFAVGLGNQGRNFEVNTFPTLTYLLSEYVGCELPLFFQIGNFLFEVTVTGLTPDW